MTEKSDSSSGENKASLNFDLIIKIALPICLGISSWCFTQLWDHENRITAIENSRYTKEDADESTKDVKEDIHSLDQGLGSLSTKLDIITGSISDMKESVAKQSVVQEYNNKKMDDIQESMAEIKKAINDKQ